MMVAVVVMMHLSSRFQRNITSSHGSLPAYSSILSYVLTTPHFVSSTLYHIFFYVRSILCPYLVSSSFFFFKFNITIMRQDRTVRSSFPKTQHSPQSGSSALPTELPSQRGAEAHPQSSFSSTEGTYTRLSSLPKLQTMAALSSTRIWRAGWASLFLPR